MFATRPPRFLPPVHFTINAALGISICVLTSIGIRPVVAAPDDVRQQASLIPVSVRPGWNLLSLPVRGGACATDSLFPTSISAAYTFRDPIGYEPRDSLVPGFGFWLKFDSAETVFLQGEALLADTIVVREGWNIIGTLSLPVHVGTLQTEPPGIIASQIFGFLPGIGYVQTDTLAPGCGYWLKSETEGFVILPAPSGYPCPGVPTVSYGGRTYTTVQIGSQCWLRENLDVGVMIQSSQDQSDNTITEKYCFGNLPVHCDSLGAYYQWGEAVLYDSLGGSRGICPPGWHVPTLAQFRILSAAVGGDGNSLKALGQGTGSGTGTNRSGFSALLAGNRSTDGQFYYVSQYGYFWTSTVHSEIFSHLLYLEEPDSTIGLSWGLKADGFNVRCILDHEFNFPPDAPHTPSPVDSSLDQPRYPTLRWSCNDPEGDPLRFTVYFGAASPPDTAVAVQQADTTLLRSALLPATTYFWRVVAIDSYGDSTHGPVWSFTTDSGATGQPCPGVPTVQYGGKTYTTVKIGTMCWLRENLDIGNRVSGDSWQEDNHVIEKYCYGNDTSSCTMYGGLYQWREAMHYIVTPGTRGICPPGWHLPTYEEYQSLVNSVGADGNALKAVGQGSGAGAGTNTSGFSGLLAGYRDYSGGSFHEVGEYGRFWIAYLDDEWGEEALHFNLWTHSAAVGHFLLVDEQGLSVRCVQDVQGGQAPQLPSTPIPEDGETDLFTSVLLQWSCEDPDGDPLNFDVYMGRTSPPDTVVSIGQPDFWLQRTGLAPGTPYFWRVVAHDNHGNSTPGPVWAFTTVASPGSPCPGTPTVSYRGKTYTTVLIGSQCWLRENLDAGLMINGSLNQTDNDSLEKYCYDNIPANCDTFGGLYQWGEVTQYTGVPGRQGVCPPGWHIPTIEEFQTLDSGVAGDGNALKAVGQGSGAGAGTNTSGFAGVLGGFRSEIMPGAFVQLGWEGYMWSSTGGADVAGYMMLRAGSGAIELAGNHRDHGFSVRCLRNDTLNREPDPPSDPVPDNGGTGVYTAPTLRWTCADPDGDSLVFNVYFGTDNPPASLVSAQQSDTSLPRTGLLTGTSYYWRVVASDGRGGTTGGPVWSFTTQTGGGTPCPSIPTVTYGGKTYNTVVIGSRCWLKENLNVGTMIDGAQNQTNNGIIEKYCYGNVPASCDTLGGLYQWREAMQYVTTSGTRGICPPGWHIPTEAQFNSLGYAVSWDANALKAIGQGYGGGSGTDTSGFSALLAGSGSGGLFSSRGVVAMHITSTEITSTTARFMTLENDDAYIRLRASDKYIGFSLRCRKD